MEKIIKILLIILFISIALINSHLFDLLWFKWGFYVEWNYEFTKVIFFNIFSSSILILFFIDSLLKKRKIKIPKLLLVILSIIILSTIFSDQTLTSLFWNASKWHSSLMYFNIVWLFIYFINTNIVVLKNLLKITIYSSILVWVIWIKEYYYPSFDYWNLQNRAVSTFWHPNYLALYILIIIPFIVKNIKRNYNKVLLIILSFLLILTKSIWWILILFIYIFYIIYIKSEKSIPKKYLSIFIIISMIWILFIVYKFWYITKLNSFLSRFYIWETTLNIIFSDIKNLIVWSGIATLWIVFDWFKSPELYLYENIWFHADRPHNLILYHFYSFWIIWLFLVIYFIYKVIKKYKFNPYYDALILFILFTIFNYPSISHYIIITLILWIIYSKYLTIKLHQYTMLTFILISLLSIYLSVNYYYFEYQKNINSSYITNNYFIKNIQNESYEKILFQSWIWDLENTCSKLILYQNSVENNFFCWNILWKINNEKSIYYYNKWLQILPNMWNENSKWYSNYFVKNLFVKERFFSEKFSNLNEILKRVWKK